MSPSERGGFTGYSRPNAETFPPPLGSRRLRSRNSLHLTSIPLSFNKPASGRKYQIIFIATRQRLLVIGGKSRVYLKCYYANLLAWKANGDPRTDDYALKKEKDRSKRQAPVTRGVHARIQKIFRQGGGSSPISHQQDWSRLRQGGRARRREVFLKKLRGVRTDPPPPPSDTRMHLVHLYHMAVILLAYITRCLA